MEEIEGAIAEGMERLKSTFDYYNVTISDQALLSVRHCLFFILRNFGVRLEWKDAEELAQLANVWEEVGIKEVAKDLRELADKFRRKIDHNAFPEIEIKE